MTTIIGLTGGIASGKSTVAKMLKNYGIPIIDADVIAREVVEVGEEAYYKIVEAFGKDILHEDGTIHREKLGAIVFNDEEQRKKLNNIVHPAVRTRMNELKQKYIEGGEKTIVLDIPLLFESKLTHLVDKIILVYVDYDVQVKRLMERNHFTREQAEARIKAQMPLKDKISLADAVLYNNGTISETEKQLAEVLKKWQII